MVTCTSEASNLEEMTFTVTCTSEASNLEEMTFTEPEIGKTKRMTVKPFARNYDPRTKAAEKIKI